MINDKLVLVDQPAEMPAKHDEAAARKFIDGINAQVGHLFEKYGIEEGSLEENLLKVLARTQVAIYLLGNELDAAGIHSRDAEWESELGAYSFDGFLKALEAYLGGATGDDA